MKYRVRVRAFNTWFQGVAVEGEVGLLCHSFHGCSVWGLGGGVGGLGVESELKIESEKRGCSYLIRESHPSYLLLISLSS